MWSSGSTELNRTNDTTATTMNNSLVYTDSYIILPLSTDDENRTYWCEVVINSSPVITGNDSITLDVTGEQCIIVCIQMW